MKGHRKYIGLPLGIILLGVSIPQSFAESKYETDGHWYAGFGVTTSSISFNEKNMSRLYAGTTDADFDHSANALKLFGGYQFDPLLGVEVGMTSFGEVVMTNNVSKDNLFMASGVYLAGTATQPLSNDVNAIAKLGMFSWTLHDKDYDELETGQGLFYGLGLDINFYNSKKRSLLIEWEHYSFSDVTLNEANTLGVSLKFRF